MRVAVFSQNLGFFDPISAAFKKRGHEVIYWKEALGDYDIGRLLSWCDVAWAEFCQAPLDTLIHYLPNHKNVFLAARIHRIEIYNQLVSSQTLDWSRVDLLFASADHVLSRFMEKRTGLSKPREVILASTNIVDPDFFVETKRKWEPPYRFCLVGNFVPKKRQYTAIQYMYDLRKKCGDVFYLDILGMRGRWTGYGNPEYYQNCLDLIEDLDLKDIVRIYDRIEHDQIPTFMGREHAIISNSNEEGTHVSIAEAALTGCIPFVSNWRGAAEVYPESVAYVFKSPGEFVEKASAFDVWANEARSQAVSQEAKTLYGDVSKYERMVEAVERSCAGKVGK